MISPCSFSVRNLLTQQNIFLEEFIKQFYINFNYVGVPERSNGIASRAIGLVPTQVQILSPTFYYEINKESNNR